MSYVDSSVESVKELLEGWLRRVKCKADLKAKNAERRAKKGRKAHEIVYFSGFCSKFMNMEHMDLAG